ncbi:hypothetical protein WJX72_001208 [[Myrmecia] bisecta]|uniref:SSD domain-containing protein n=1 Tax=[Myrmecia] bisecta TaxID=41462 RepID=A0AAW1P3W3_9CHLO
MPQLEAVCRAGGKICIRHPKWIVALLAAGMAVITAVCFRLDMQVDSGVDSFYVRQNTIADRANADFLLGSVLWDHPSGQAPGMQLLGNLTGRQTGASSLLDQLSAVKSAGLAGKHDGRKELHVLVHAKDGSSVFEPSKLRRLCRMKHGIEAAARAQQTCYHEQPASEDGQQAAPAGSVQSMQSTPQAASDLHAGPCAPSWSLFDLRGAYDMVGLGGVLDLLVGAAQNTTQSSAQGYLSALISACRTGLGGLSLCADGRLPCSAAGCVAGRCEVLGVDACALLAATAPTAADLAALAALPAAAADQAGCDDLDLAAFAANLRAGQVLNRWGQASAATQVVGMPMTYLVDRDFAHVAKPRSSLTRLVFRLENGPNISASDFTFQIASQVLHPANGEAGLELSWREWDYFDAEGQRSLFRDLMWSIGSLGFVALYIWWETGSLFMTLGGLAGVLASLPLAYFLYAAVLGIRWLGVLNFLGVFVVLGLGADDMFVLADHWKVSELQPPPICESGEARMAWTYRQALSSIAATSFTTIAAFAANTISAVAPIRLFGLFMVLLVGSNFVLIAILMPALIAWRHQRYVRSTAQRGSAAHSGSWQRLATSEPGEEGDVALELAALETEPGTPLPGGGGLEMVALESERGTLSPGGSVTSMSEGWEPADSSQHLSRCKGPLERASHPGYDLDSAANSPLRHWHVPHAKEKGRCPDSRQQGKSRFRLGSCSRHSAAVRRRLGHLRHHVSRHLQERQRYGRAQQFFGGPVAAATIRWRWLIAALMVANMVGSLFLAAQLETPSERPSVWQPGHNQRRYFNTELLFEAGRAADSIAVKFVWGLTPRDVTSTFMPHGRGDLQLDLDFDVSRPEAQLWMAGFCERLSSDPLLLEHTVPGSQHCFMAGFARYLALQGAALPLPPAQFQRLLRDYALVADSLGEDSPGLFFAPGDTGEGGGRVERSTAQRSGRRLVAWDLRANAGKENTGYARFNSSRADVTLLRAVEVSVKSRSLLAQPYAELHRDWAFWEAWFVNATADAPPGLQNGFQTSGVWLHMATEASLLSSAFWSLGLSLLLALLVLLATTGNVVVAGTATLCISSVVATALGFMRLAGWKLGIVETICITILVGLSVDYVVHVANGFVHCHESGRAARVHSALRTVGMSIVSGAATTIGAALFLFGCRMIVFLRFGAFICVTLSAALLHALLVFPALYGQGDVYSSFFSCRRAAEALASRP